jgi:hypothetical protein
MMEAVSISEMSVNFYQATEHNIPKDSHLHTHCYENLKSHINPLLHDDDNDENANNYSTVSLKLSLTWADSYSTF